jgi:hypothetical protein
LNAKRKRGRRLVITVQAADVARVEIECRSRFHVRVPRDLDELARLEGVRDAFDAWLRERALKDARAFARRHQAKLGVEPAGVRVGDQQRSWGTCGKDKVVRINWRLIQAPAAAMEYVCPTGASGRPYWKDGRASTWWCRRSTQCGMKRTCVSLVGLPEIVNVKGGNRGAVSLLASNSLPKRLHPEGGRSITASENIRKTVSA